MSPQPYAIMYHQGPPRHALSMCHTIQYTSLKQIHKIHTFTHEKLKHTISDPIATVLYHQTLLQLNQPLFFKAFPQIHNLPSCSMQMYATFPIVSHICTRPILMQLAYNLKKIWLPILCNFETFATSNLHNFRKMMSHSTLDSLIYFLKYRPYHS
jgi:hypothetical protein